MNTEELSPRSLPTHEKPLPIMVGMVLFVVVVCISMIALDGWRTWQARGIELRESEVVASNLSRSLAQHAQDVVTNADTTLLGLVDLIQVGGTGPAERHHLYSLLSTEVGNSPWLQGLFVYDEQGHWVVNSVSEKDQNFNNADREYFNYHRTHIERGPHIGVPIRSRSSGEWILTVSRRVNHADGSFAGVVLATISMDYFQRFYAGFDIGKDRSMTLLLNDGTVLVRSPFSESSIGASMASNAVFKIFINKQSAGNVATQSTIDQAGQIHAFQRVDYFPLVVDVALSQDEVLEKWRTDTIWHSAGVGILVLVLATLGYRLIVQIRWRLKIQAQLTESEKRVRMIADNMPAFIAYIDSDKCYRFGNSLYLQEFGVSSEEFLGCQMQKLLGDEAYAELEPHINEALAGNKVVFERHTPERGADSYALYHYVPDIDVSGKVVGFYSMVLDITPRKVAELQLSAKEKLLRGLTDHLPALVSYIDREERFQFNNRPYEDWLGKPLSEITGKHVREATGEESYLKYKRFFDQALTGENVDFSFASVVDGTKHYYKAAYIPQRDEQDKVVGICSMINDITELKKVELQLIKLARIDSLTGLPNRMQFDDTLRKSILRSRRSGMPMALMYLDIDHFKSINDTYGHQAGDEALREFARRLSSAVRKTDHIARLSGDEFVIVLEEMKSQDEAEIVARKILKEMAPAFSFADTEYQVTTSIGIAVLSKEDADAQALLRRADQALYSVKSGGRGSYTVAELSA